MRTETAYDILQNCYQNDRNVQQAFQDRMIGTTVLTSYNNKTYRIDDVDFTINPMNTFVTRDGEVSYKAYYKRKYNIDIHDPRQPLLISKAKERDIRAGLAPMISLVPELCRATGLTDRMKSDYK